MYGYRLTARIRAEVDQGLYMYGYRLTARIRLRLIEGYTCMGID